MPHKRKDSSFWWASFIDANGKRGRCSTGTAERKEGQALEAKWKGAAFQQQARGAGLEHTFDELILVYLKGPAIEKRSARTDRQRAKCLRAFFLR